MAAACPDTDAAALASLARELPRISPELSLVFAHRDRIYAMTPDEWMQFNSMRRAA